MDAPRPSLTYEPFFGLNEKPFSLSADPRFLFKSPSHGRVFDALLAGIRRREGLIALTGEIGTGKTTLCRAVLGQLDRRTFASFVPDPFVSREDLLKMLLVDFGVVSVGDLKQGRLKGASRPELSYPLYEFLDSLVPLQAFAVLVIDEAQNLPLPLLEEIRILSELERREKLLQVVLVGQPELRANLKTPEMRQVDQRVSVRCELSPLDAEGVTGYVNHRLAVAGYGASRVEFPPEALEAVFLGSAGVPRLINRICDRALDRAHSMRTCRIDARFVKEAIDDLGLAPLVMPVVVPLAPPPAAPSATMAAPVPDAPGAIEEPLSQAAVTQAPPSAAPLPSTAAALPTLDAAVPISLATEPPRPAVMPPVTMAPRPVVPRRAPADAPRARRSPAVAIVASAIVVAAAAAAAGVWYVRNQAPDPNGVVAMLPAPPPREPLVRPAAPPPADGAVVPVTTSPERDGRPGGTTPAGEVELRGPGLESRAPDGPYMIEVAAFESRARAERLVGELTTAGYRAHDVAIDLGPARGTLVQVVVGGYSSAIEVERDLRRIRALPGGYGDARLVERNAQ